MALTQISTAGVKDDAVTAGKIPANAVGSSELADNAVDNAAVASNAAIAGSKISPDFGSQAISTTNDSVTIGDSIIHSGDTNTKIRFPAADTISFECAGEEVLKINRSSSELLRISGPIDGSTQQEFGIGIAVNDEHTHPAAKITLKEFDASDSRGDLLFYTRGTNNDVASTERLRIDSSGSVIIGDDASDKANANFNDLVVGKADSTTETHGITIVCGNAATNGGIAFSDGSNGGADAYRGMISYQHNDNHMQFRTNASERMRLDSSGRLLVGTTTQNNNAALQVSTTQQVVASFEGTGASDPQIYLGDDMSSPTNNALIFGYDKADNRGYLTIAGDADTTLTISDGSLVGINTSANAEHFNVAGNMRFVNPTGTTRRIIALPSGGYTVGSTGGAAVAFHRISDGGGGSDEIAFETHHQGNRHAESARISKFGGITFNGDTAAVNALDDYEEGTFTGGFNDFNGTYSYNTGTYTKIGNVVTIQIMLAGSGGSGSGALMLTSLPFNSEATPSSYRAVGTVHAHTGLVTGGKQIRGLMNNNENKVRIRTVENNATTTDLNRNGLNSGGWEVVIGITYHTAA